MDVLQELKVLEELLSTAEQLRQHKGIESQRGRASSSRKLRLELADYSSQCLNGTLTGRERKRKSGELFRKIVRLGWA